MNAYNLLPCPFCGSEPEWINEAIPDSHYYIRCPNCKFVMNQDRRDKVIGIWNTRFQPSTKDLLMLAENLLRSIICADPNVIKKYEDSDIVIRDMYKQCKTIVNQLKVLAKEPDNDKE